MTRPAAASPAASVLPADLLVIGCGVVAALHVGKLPGALPLLREGLGLTLVQAGFLLSMVQLGGMTLALPLGLMAGRWGLRRTLLAGLATLAVASAAGAFAQRPATLMAWRALEGMGFLLVTLSAPALLRRLVPLEHLSRRIGWWGAYMPAGTATALLVGPWVMASAGWPGWWLVLGAVAAATAAWSLRTVPPDPPAIAPAADAGWLATLQQTLGRAGPWLVALTFGCYSSQWLTVIGFLPSLYVEAGVSNAHAGALTALVALANVTGNIASGRLLQRGVAAERLLLTGFATMAGGAFVAYGLTEWAPAAVRFVAVILFSAVGGLIPGTLFALAVRVAPSDRAVPAVVGWALQLSALGQFTGPPAAAWWASVQGNWTLTWVMTGSACLVGAGLAWRLGGLLRRSSPPASVP